MNKNSSQLSAAVVSSSNVEDRGLRHVENHALSENSRETNMKPENIQWSAWTRTLEHYLRLKTFPVGLKMLEDSAEFSGNKWIRRPQEKLSLCQMITIVRTFDWTIGITADDLVTPGCAAVLGLSELPNFITDGTMRSMVPSPAIFGPNPSARARCARAGWARSFCR